MNSNRPIKGSTIVMALGVLAVVTVLAVGLLSRRVSQRNIAQAQFIATQAEAIAWAGLEDARCKLMKSKEFPPVDHSGVDNFSYSETLTDSSGKSLGTYVVEVDTGSPEDAVIFSSAVLPGEKASRLTLRGTLDVLQERESLDTGGNVITENRPFRWLRIERENNVTSL